MFTAFKTTVGMRAGNIKKNEIVFLRGPGVLSMYGEQCSEQISIKRTDVEPGNTF